MLCKQQRRFVEAASSRDSARAAGLDSTSGPSLAHAPRETVYSPRHRAMAQLRNACSASLCRILSCIVLIDSCPIHRAITAGSTPCCESARSHGPIQVDRSGAASSAPVSCSSSNSTQRFLWRLVGMASTCWHCSEQCGAS